MKWSSDTELVRARPLLGTFVVIRGAGAAPDILQRGVEDAFQRIERVHALMSFHEAASELSLMNRDACDGNVRVSPETFEVLKLAQHIFIASGGLFDVAVAPHLVRSGYLPQHGKVVAPVGTTADIELRPGRRVRFARPLQVDLGGIAKGYAVDAAIEALQRAGVGRGTVNAGGDLRVYGSAPETVYVRDPRLPNASLPLAEIRNGSLATSATYFARRRVGGRFTSPVVHPIRRTACLTLASVSVFAARCAVADALTKVVMLNGTGAFDLLRRFSASAVIITASGRTIRSDVPRAA